MNLFRRRPTQPKPQPKPAPPARQPACYVRAEPPALSDRHAETAALHPAQVRPIDWQAEADAEARQLPAPRSVRPIPYVPAASEIIMPRVNLASPDASLTADLTPPAVVESKTFGGHQDRARAWLRYSLPLCVTFAIATTIAAVGLYRVPLISAASGLTFFLSFLVAYAVLLLRYWQHTPEGVALKNVDYLWGYYKTEQTHRHQIERQAWQDQRAITTRRDSHP